MATLEVIKNRSVILLYGEGVLQFLHNILTCSVADLQSNQIVYGALLSPQGKIQHDVFVHRLDDLIAVDCSAAGRDDLVQKFKLYRLRAKFEIEPNDGYEVVYGDGEQDPRHPDLGLRGFVPRSFPEGEFYEANRYHLGIADSAEIGSGKLFPHEANLDLLGGIDFKKGCYVGQEVVSRMHHRGTVRSRILPVTFESEHYLNEIRDGELLVGEVLGRRGCNALALMRLDRLVGQLPCKVQMPSWMKT